MLIDSHCHLDFAVFHADRATVCRRAAAVGVDAVVIPAVARQMWQPLSELVLPDVIRHYCAYGLHPMFVQEHQRSDTALLEVWVQQHPTVAVGEVGLDGRFADSLLEQQWYFEAQLDIAWRYRLPVIIHAHRALEQVLQTIRRYSGVSFVIHAFSGSDQQLDRIFSLGGVIGIGGTVTYPRAQRLRRQVSRLSAGQYLLETDAPDQPICGHQGQRNEPLYLESVMQVVAELRACAPAVVAEESTTTAVRFFHLH